MNNIVEDISFLKNAITCKISDFKQVRNNIVELVYYREEAFNFTLLYKLKALYLSDQYKHFLNFLQNTKFTILGLWNNNCDKLLNNIPHNVKILELIHLTKPLVNISCMITKIVIYDEPDEQLLSKSKIPHGCEIIHGKEIKKYEIEKKEFLGNEMGKFTIINPMSSRELEYIQEQNRIYKIVNSKVEDLYGVMNAHGEIKLVKKENKFF